MKGRTAGSTQIRSWWSTCGAFLRRRAQARLRLTQVLTLSLIAFLLAVPTPANAAAAGPVVSLTFDNGSKSQYDLAYPQLTSHGAHATFFVSSGTITTNQGANFMTWAKLQELQAAGNDIGGKTVNASNLTTLSTTDATNQVCNDRQALISHALTAVSFAYPGGSTNASVKDIVKKCGYGNARIAGGLGVTAGATNAETLPPADWLATRAYAPGTVTLANMQSIVSNAASKGGGWIQIVMGRICDQATDPGNYTSCSNSAGHIELADLRGFLDWVTAAGQTGGAPSGTSLNTVANVIKGADNVAPTTTITCNGSPCSNSSYDGAVTVALSGTDLGSGVSSTHYTTDGSDPTLSSPTYTAPFGVNGTGATTTVKFRSWDRANNVEAVQTQVILAPSDNTAPVTTISCNGSPCTGSPYVDSVSVALSATDTGGAGLDKTYYTTDGSTPTTSSTVYTGPFQLSSKGATNVQFFSTDRAGNAEAVQSQQIQVIPYTTTVSLAFDDGTSSQYTLGYQQALQPHGASATFFVNSGTVGFANFMSWNQLGTLATAGNDIGGKTVNATNLTTDSDPQSQVCNDRQALIQHGLNPIVFAYPGGTGFNNQTIRDIVKNCGYGNARRGGGLSPSGATYAESVPPADWFATRAYTAPSGQPMTLSNMKSLVTGAAAHHGGWVQIVIQKVCQSSDSTCNSGTGNINIDDLNAFLDWVQVAGQANGAPAGTIMQTVRDQIVAADAVVPATAISCDVGPCSGGPYNSVVRATLTATDTGSGVESTHYTTDGSSPSQSSPAYTGPIPITSQTTLKFRSWDRSGNAEPTQSQTIDAEPPPDTTAPTTSIACNGSACGSSTYRGTVTLSFSVDDGSGWGVDKTFYTTDGSTPDTNSTKYTGPFQLTQPETYTIKFFSTDLAGNAETPQAQQIQLLPPRTVVSLTWDDGTISQFELGYKRALEPHGMKGTFFINTGNISEGANFMTWADLSTLERSGDEIAGHTIDDINLKTAPDLQTKIHQVCDNRQDLIDHGLDPVDFAYPQGAFDQTAKDVVRDCGFSSARAAGPILSGGPVYSETIPPADMYAIRAKSAINAQEYTLSDLEAVVTAAAAHGGGWVPVVGHKVCSATYDPSRYDSCKNSTGPIELDTLNAFLDWLQNAGQPGGAPAGTVVQNMRTTLFSPDTTAPVTTALCDGSLCQNSSYGGSTSVTLSAKDTGGVGVLRTYYTTDGSSPTTSSPVSTQPIIVTQSKTIKFFSVDNAGNVEQVQSQEVQIGSNTDPIIAAAGDIACDPTTPAFNGGEGTSTDCRARGTSNLLVGADAVLPLGDDQYNCGGTSAYAQSYDPTWGQFKSLTYPVPGDKDYATSGGTDCPSTPGAGYYSYFGDRAGDPSKGYYSYDIGSWHMIALNSAQCPDDPRICATGSAQERWLSNDLAQNPASCTLAYFQNPRFGSGPSGGSSTYAPFWRDLYNAGADVVLNGDAHWYERFQPLDPSGAVDQDFGIREFIVGTGGAGLATPSTQLATSAALDNSTHGVLRMTLTANGYEWQFVPDEGTFTDSGNASCHNQADAIAPTSSIACNGNACSGVYTAPVSVTLSANDGGGSGVAKTYYTTDGSTPTTSSTVYNGAFQVSQSGTVKFFSTDQAGNAEQPQSKDISIDSTAPTSSIACNGNACSGVYTAPVSVTLSADDGGGSGVDKTYYTTDGSAPTTASTVYNGAFQVSQTTTVKFFSTDQAGNAEQVQSQDITVVPLVIDLTPPTSSIACNGNACSGVYTSAVSVTLSANDGGGSGVDKTYYTTDGSTPTTSSTVYTGAFQVSQTATVKFFSTDQAGNAEQPQSKDISIDSTAPTSSIACNGNACSGVYTSAVSVTLSANDGGGSGVDKTYYTTDGSTPTTSSTVYTGAFQVSQTATVKFFSTDQAGNAEQPQSKDISIDSTAPTSSIACNGNACSGVYTSAVSVTLSANDGGGSGVDKTYYTTDGSTPTTASTVYNGAFQVSQTTTVQFFSTDHAGNAEQVKSQAITVVLDTTPPTTTMACNGSPCGTGWFKKGPISVSLSAADTGGSGVDKTYYTTNGSTPTTASTLYTGPFNLNKTTTVKFFSTDKAGNAEEVKTQQLSIDAAAPVTTIACNGSACATWYKSSPVSVSLSATDSGGVGVDKTYYTTNGSTPTTSSPQYTAAFQVSQTTTVKFFSTDKLGNTEVVKTATIQIDTAAPSVSVTSPTTGQSFSQGTRVSITATAADTGTGAGAASGVASVAFVIDNTTVIDTDTSKPYSTTWATAKVGLGQHTIRAVATDAAGNATTSAPVTVTIT